MSQAWKFIYVGGPQDECTQMATVPFNVKIYKFSVGGQPCCGERKGRWTLFVN